MENRLKHIWFVLLAVFILLSIAEAKSQEQQVFVNVITEKDTLLTVTDSQMLNNALPIYFKVNRSDIESGDENFDKLKRKLQSLGGNFTCRLIIIRSSSSPEGSYANNVALSHRRARAIVDSLRQYITILDGVIEERYISEDYEGLRHILSDSDAPYRYQVIRIIDEYRGNDSEIKNRLKKLDSGIIWQQILKDYYPLLRASRVLLFISPQHLLIDDTQKVEARKIDIGHAMPHYEAIGIAPAPTNEKPTYRPILNIKTNLLYDLAACIPQYGWAPTPNVSVEFMPRSGHLTAVAEYMHSGWRSDSRLKTWIIRDLLFEMRYYLNGDAAFTGHYFAIYANTAKYDIQLSAQKAWISKRYRDTWGAGLGWGYVKRFGKSPWKWEVNIAAGFLDTDYDRYHPAEEWAEPDRFYYNWHDSPELFVKLRNKFNYIGITRLGFSLSYDLPWLEWKNRKGGRR